MQDKIEKLPKWAQDHIKKIERERDAAQAVLKKAIDEQTPSPVYVDEWNVTPRVRRNVQTTSNRVCFDYKNVHLEVFLPYDGDGQREEGIELTFGLIEGRGQAVVFPSGYGKLAIISPEKMIKN